MIGNKKVNSRKILQVFTGTFIIALAISLIVQGKYGADTISVFILGIMNHVNLPFGVLSILINSCILVIAFAFAKNQLGIGSIINATFLGLFILLLEMPISFVMQFQVVNYFVLIIGPILFGIGSAIYVAANQGSAALECLSIIIVNRNERLSLKVARIILEAVLVVLGILLGASFGIGTLLCVLIIGPVMERTLNILQSKSLRKVSDEEVPTSY